MENLVQVTGSNLTYVYVVLGISLVALAIAYALRAQVLAANEGTEKMQEIAAAVQEGAAAYLNRQFKTLSYFVGIVFFLLFALPGEFEIRVEGQEPKTVKTGDAFMVPPNTIHDALNTGSTKGKILATYFVEKGKPVATFVN